MGRRVELGDFLLGAQGRENARKDAKADMPDVFQQAVDSAQQSEMRLILQRLEQIERKLDQQLTDHESRLREVEQLVIRLDARVNAFGLIQTAYATIVSVVAAWLGRM